MQLKERIGIKTHVITSLMKQMEQKQRSLIREAQSTEKTGKVKRSRIAKPTDPKEPKQRGIKRKIREILSLDDSVKHEANATQESVQINASEATTSAQASDGLVPQEPQTPVIQKETPTPSKNRERKIRRLRESNINLPREPKKKPNKRAAAQEEENVDGISPMVPKKRGRKIKSEFALPETSTPIVKSPRKGKGAATPTEKTPKDKTPKEKSSPKTPQKGKRGRKRKTGKIK